MEFRLADDASLRHCCPEWTRSRSPSARHGPPHGPYVVVLRDIELILSRSNVVRASYDH
jgi:hypothetical protein